MSNPFDAAEFVPARLVDSAETLQAALNSVIKDKSRESVRTEYETSGTRGNLVYRAFRRYSSAMTASKKFGFVGVGRFTFAENRLAKFCKRVNLTV